MIGVHGIPISPAKMLVKTVHYRLENLPEENRKKFIVVDSVPEKEILAGKRAVRYINPKTKEQWIEYKDKPPSQEETLIEMSAKLDELNTKIAELVELTRTLK